MPSSWSPSLRFELQFTGENINLWGDKLNAVLTHADYAVAGWLTKALTGDYALTAANAADDEARAAMLKFTGAGPFAVTIPSVSKAYDVWNACAAPLTVKTGAGTAVTLNAGEIARVVCDGSNVRRSQGTEFGGQQITGVADPTSAQMAATMGYVTSQIMGAMSGSFPGQAGAGGSALFTNGATPFWKPIASTDLSDFNSNIKGLQVALAVAL
jgi:hypothetical protein